MLARCRTLLHAAGIRAVITFADPSARSAGIRLLSGQQHLPRYHPDPHDAVADRRDFPGRAHPGKIRKQEREHAAAVRPLVGFGVRPMRTGQQPHAWRRDALADARVGPSPAKHRYAMPLRRDVKVYTRDRTGRPVRTRRDLGRYPKPSADLFTAKECRCDRVGQQGPAAAHRD